MDKTKQFLITRFPGDYAVCGSPTMLWDWDKTIEGLMVSSFFRPWIEQKIAEHLASGKTIDNVSPQGKVISRYKLATEQDIIDLAASGMLEVARGNVSAKSARTKMAKQTTYHFSTKTPALEALKLPKQAKQILGFVWEYEKLSLSEQELGALLEAKKASGLITSVQPMLRVFGFYKKPFFENGCLKETAEEVEVADEGPEDPQR